MVRKLFPAVLLMGFFWSLVSCKENCERKPCENGGTCIEGSCQCYFPWEGYRCRTHAASKFTGTWQGTSDCVSDTFRMKIEANGVELKLVDEPKHSFDLRATLTDNNTFEIPAQNRGTIVGRVTITGRGTYRGGLIYLDIRYDYDANFWDKECRHTLRR